MALGLATSNLFAEKRLAVAGNLLLRAVSAGIPSSNGTMIGYGFRKADSKYSQFGNDMIWGHYVGLTVLVDQLACLFVVLSLRPGTSKHSSSK